MSDEELSGPGSRESYKLGTITGATSAELGPSLEAHAERASDRKHTSDSKPNTTTSPAPSESALAPGMESTSSPMGSRWSKGSCVWKAFSRPWRSWRYRRQSARSRLLRKSAVASMEALEYLHRVWRSGNARVRNRVMGEVNERRPKRKRVGGDAAQCLDRWRRLVMDPMRASFLVRRAGRVLA